MRAIGINEFLEKTFIVYPFAGKWYESFAEPEKNFRMLVFGKPGNGKTEFCIQLAKYLAQFTKVYYNSFEQGISKSLQDAIKRNNLGEVSGKIIFGDKETHEEMVQRLRNKNSPSVVIIDSRDYLNLTTREYIELVELFPRKAFVIICWESGGKPKGEYAQAIEFMVDIKVHVRQFKAYPRCRFGGNVPFVIWEGYKHHSFDLFNQDK
jgi:hypothetical protein